MAKKAQSSKKIQSKQSKSTDAESSKMEKLQDLIKNLSGEQWAKWTKEWLDPEDAEKMDASDIMDTIKNWDEEEIEKEIKNLKKNYFSFTIQSKDFKEYLKKEGFKLSKEPMSLHHEGLGIDENDVEITARYRGKSADPFIFGIEWSEDEDGFFGAGIESHLSIRLDSHEISSLGPKLLQEIIERIKDFKWNQGISTGSSKKDESKADALGWLEAYTMQGLVYRVVYDKDKMVSLEVCDPEKSPDFTYWEPSGKAFKPTTLKEAGSVLKRIHFDHLLKGINELKKEHPEFDFSKI